MRHADFRRVRRSDEAATRPRDLQPRVRRPVVGTFCRARHRDGRVGWPVVSGADEHRHQAVPHPQGVRSGGVGQAGRTVSLRARQLQRDEGVRRAQGRGQAPRCRGRRRRQRAVLLRGRAAVLRPVVRQPACVGLQGRPRLEAGHRRETVRHLAGLRAQAQPRGPRELAGERDLSRRSLPRQRNGAEPPRVPVLERDVRAAVEQELHRQYPVQRLRSRRRRGSRRLLRLVRRRARHDAEPHVPDARVSVHGGTRLVRARRDPEREGEAVAVGAALLARGGHASRGARPVRPVARQARLSPGEERQSHVEHRDLRRGAVLHRQLALGRRADLSALRQGALEARHGNHRGIQEGAGRDLPRHTGDRARRQPARVSHPAVPGHRDPVPGQDPGASHTDSSSRFT